MSNLFLSLDIRKNTQTLHKMKTEQYQIFHDTKKKLEKVIDSCETHYHIIGARNYYRLWHKQMKRVLNLNSMFCTNWDLYYSFHIEIRSMDFLINNKWNEINKRKS